MGRFASLELPRSLQSAEIRLFAWLAGVDLAEAHDPVDAYRSLQQFFKRSLKPGARPISGDESTIVSPCDGAWGESGRIQSGTLMQVKGRPYSVSELLGGGDRAAAFEGGCFATFYLSPRDYHRFHTPMAGRIAHLDYHPGALWPVNEIGLLGVDRLFARNERICAFLTPDRPVTDHNGFTLDEAPIAMVAVGATMVGSVRLRFDEMGTNRAGGLRSSKSLTPDAPHFSRGEEWGHFEFGSTIILLTPPGAISINFRPAGEALRLGQVIGHVLSRAAESVEGTEAAKG